MMPPSPRTRSLLVGCVWSLVFSVSTNGFTSLSKCQSRPVATVSFTSKKNADDNGQRWDDGVDYDKDWPEESDSSPDPNSDWKLPRFQNDETPRLGIDIGLEPLTQQQADEIKAQATELINDAVAAGLDDIQDMRDKMKESIDKSKRAMQAASDYNARRESEKLLGRIDRLTQDFMDSTKASRESTKLASAADQAMEGKGVDYGTWGTLGGAAVTTGGTALLGSVNAATNQQDAPSDSTETENTAQQQNRLLVIADDSQDPMAKKIIPNLVPKLETVLPGIDVQQLKPSATMPLGGNEAACILVFLTSLSGDRSTLNNLLDRLLRRTLQAGGRLGSPPTQLVAVSTLGTERIDKFPYSMQNFMGGKLEKRRQLEEALIQVVRQRMVEPALDYTICKLGDIQDTTTADFAFAPGDVLDGTTALDTATEALVQAVALQPSARNSTFSVTGSLPTKEDWNDAFLRLDGPELQRWTTAGGPERYDQLVEYMYEWAQLLADTGKGLTTPVLVEPSQLPPLTPREKVQQRMGVKLLFKPTATGKRYMSRKEEKQREQQGGGKGGTYVPNPSRLTEGGIEVVIELDDKNQLRARARRCNYSDDAVIKELSEETILKRLSDSIAVWENDIVGS